MPPSSSKNEKYFRFFLTDETRTMVSPDTNTETETISNKINLGLKNNNNHDKTVG